MFDNLFYLTGNDSAYDIRQSYYYSLLSSSSPKVIVQGSVNFIDAVHLNGTLVSSGDVTIRSGSTVENIMTNGNLTSNEGSNHIGNVTVGGNVSDNNSTIKGTISHGTTNIPLFSTISFPAFETPEKILNADLIKSSSTFVSTTSSSPSYFNMVCTKPLYLQNINGNDLRYNGSNCKNLVLSAGDSNKDIVLIANDDSVTLKEISIYIDAANTRNVYIYLTGTSTTFTTLNLAQTILGGTKGDFLNGKVSVSTPKLYIMGNAAQTVHTSERNSIHAYIYLPLGTLTFAEGGNSKEPAINLSSIDTTSMDRDEINKLQGSGMLLTGGATVKNFSVGDNTPKFLYVSPDYNNMPDGLVTETGDSKWAITSWASQ